MKRTNGRGDGGRLGSEDESGALPYVYGSDCEIPHCVHAGGVHRGCVCGHALASRAHVRVHGVR